MAWRRLAASMMIAGVLLGAAPARAESAIGSGEASAAIDFKVVIPLVLRSRLLRMPQTFTVDARQAAQGFVDLPNAAEVSVLSNSQQGFDLSVAYDARLVQRVEVGFAGESVRADNGGTIARIPLVARSERELPVACRLYLARGVKPGTYPWPVKLRLGAASV